MFVKEKSAKAMILILISIVCILCTFPFVHSFSIIVSLILFTIRKSPSSSYTRLFPRSFFLSSCLSTYLSDYLLVRYPFPLIRLYRKNGRSPQTSRRRNKWISFVFPYHLPIFLIHADGLVSNNDLFVGYLLRVK